MVGPEYPGEGAAKISVAGLTKKLEVRRNNIFDLPLLLLTAVEDLLKKTL